MPARGGSLWVASAHSGSTYMGTDGGAGDAWGGTSAQGKDVSALGVNVSALRTQAPSGCRDDTPRVEQAGLLLAPPCLVRKEPHRCWRQQGCGCSWRRSGWHPQERWSLARRFLPLTADVSHTGWAPAAGSPGINLRKSGRHVLGTHSSTLATETSRVGSALAAGSPSANIKFQE